MNEEDFILTFQPLGYSVSRYTGKAKEIGIPAKLGNRIIFSIDPCAFENQSQLTRVTIPHTVLKIGKHAFKGCVNLEEVQIAAKVVEIEEGAFSNCHALKKVNLPSSLKKIGPQAFSGCSSLESIRLPDGIKSCGGRLFEDCGMLSDIGIPESFKILGNALAGCTGISSILLPESIRKIGVGAFMDCTRLKQIKIPGSVEEIAPGAFKNCINLEHVIVPASLKSSIVKQPAILQVVMPGAAIGLAYLFNECPRLNRVTIDFQKDCDLLGALDLKKFDFAPNLEITGELLHIRESMFSRMSVVRHMIINTHVVKIEKKAFEKCRNLESVEIPESVASLDIEAFRGCDSLRDIRIASENPTYEATGILLIEKNSKVLLKCAPSVKGELVIPDEITGIGPRAFEGCMSLTSVVVPDSIESIAEEALAGFRYSVHETMRGSRRFELANQEEERRKSQINSDEAPVNIAELIAMNFDDEE